MATLAAAAIAGIFIKGYFGGLITGSCAASLLFVTVGKLVYLKAQKKMDAVNSAIFRAVKASPRPSPQGEGEDSEATNK